MIVTRLTGGLGNQMFQYAFGRRLAEKHNTELKLDLGFYSDKISNSAFGAVRQFDLDIFNIRKNIASQDEVNALSRRSTNKLVDRVLNKFLGFKPSVLLEPHFHFSSSAFNAPDNIYLIGYWQSPRYFSDVEALIRSEFSFKREPSERAREYQAHIERSNSVCVHVRRGDFVIHPLNGLYGADYYNEGERIIAEKVSNPTYFVFSDDIEWCEQNLRFNGETVFISDDFSGQKLADDFRLMVACKHFIIANSSFSWWAAWLNNERHKLVVAPKAWFRDEKLDTKDLIPEKWIRI